VVKIHSDWPPNATIAAARRTSLSVTAAGGPNSAGTARTQAALASGAGSTRVRSAATPNPARKVAMKMPETSRASTKSSKSERTSWSERPAPASATRMLEATTPTAARTGPARPAARAATAQGRAPPSRSASRTRRKSAIARTQ
jgi:hypothetical protein